jgi:hypothetical protein
MQNNELKDNMETKCQSPKIFLNRLPPFLEVEKSVNVNDILLKGSLDKMAASPKSISNRNHSVEHLPSIYIFSDPILRPLLPD